MSEMFKILDLVFGSASLTFLDRFELFSGHCWRRTLWINEQPLLIAVLRRLLSVMVSSPTFQAPKVGWKIFSRYEWSFCFLTDENKKLDRFSLECRKQLSLRYSSLWLVIKTETFCTTNEKQNQSQSCLHCMDFPALWHRLREIALYSDWFIVVFAFYVIGQCNYWKTRALKVRNAHYKRPCPEHLFSILQTWPTALALKRPSFTWMNWKRIVRWVVNSSIYNWMHHYYCKKSKK